MNVIVQLMVACGSFVLSSGQRITCLDESAAYQDYYYGYKLPKIHEAKPPFNTGTSLIRATAGDIQKGHIRWHLADESVENVTSILGKTFAQLYDAVKFKTHSNLAMVMYSDQVPGRRYPFGSYAHAKGVLAFDPDTNSGFWLVHSVPHYPSPLSAGYEYPDSGHQNGQTFMCISFNASEHADMIVGQLILMDAMVYDKLTSEAAFRIAPRLRQLVTRSKRRRKGKRQKGGSLFSIDSMQIGIGSRSLNVTTFSKTSKWNKELYADLIAPVMESNLVVETWRKGAGDPLPSECDHKYIVQNVDMVHVKDSDRPTGSLQWDFLKDHAKWAAALSLEPLPPGKIAPERPVVCIADINRMLSQYKRGGGALCFENDSAWSLFNQLVQGIEGCKFTSSLTRHNNTKMTRTQN